MRQLRDMSIMEIDITNACDRLCSNCTRFCGHHRRTYFMDFGTFRRAVDSLDAYQGLVSIIGGEPLLHPEYDRFAEYLTHRRPWVRIMNDGRNKAIVKDYPMMAKKTRWLCGALNRGRGHSLFTSMSKNYYLRYESIQDSVTDLWLNDHTNPSLHQPILVSRKDLGIPDEEFEKLRDKCWLQNFWSGSITPKGCFFCEVAGTLDMLYNGPGGKPIEPGWWEQDLSAFRDQFHWCDLCGMALSTYSRSANDEVDDASSSELERLKMLESPKLGRGKVVSFDAGNRGKKNANIGLDMETITANYQVDYDKRVGLAAANLKPKNFVLGLDLAPVRDIEALDIQPGLSCVVVIPFSRYREWTASLTSRFPSNEFRFVAADEVVVNLGGRINLMLRELKSQEWLALSEPGFFFPDGIFEKLKGYFLNPGYLFVLQEGTQRAVLMTAIAHTIERVGRDRLACCGSLEDLIALWGAKTYLLEKNFEDIPDENIPYFRAQIWKDYEEDTDFVTRLSARLVEEGAGRKILLLQSAFVYHTLGIYHVLDKLGYEVYLLSSQKFKGYFDGVVSPDKTLYFDAPALDYTSQADVREAARKFGCCGTVVPFSFGPSTIKPIDDYTDALRTAQEITGKTLGIINIRRQFIEPEYDLWGNCR